MGNSLLGLRIDVETKSATDIAAGAYKYAEDPEFEMLIISYAPLRDVAGVVRMGKPRQLDLRGDTSQFKRIIQDPGFQKHAYNANFERITLSKWLGLPHGTYLDPENWRCTAVQANVAGVQGKLDEVARHLRSPLRKDKEGARLIRLFSRPVPKTGLFHRYVMEGEPFAGRHCWCGVDHEKDSATFRDYCDGDVMAEAGVAALIPGVAPEIQAEYEADQRINDRGFRHFKKMADAAVAAVTAEQARLMEEMKDLTGVENPNSGQQIHRWLEAQDYPMTSLDKAARAEALSDPLIPDEVAELLTLKGLASLSSVSKHKAALRTRCEDGRIRGSLQFYGAHTGREAGRGIQPQNLPRYEAPLSDMRLLVSGNAGSEAPRIAKGCVRASIVPARGNVFAVLDYNAIEARTLGWAAGEKWVEAEFRGEGKIYEATASMMFGCDKAQLIMDLKACGKCGSLSCAACVTRAKGKVSNLALGYAGGAGALITMGAEDAGIDCGNYNDLHAEWEQVDAPPKFHEWERDRHDYPELLRLRDLYRTASPATVRFWKLCAAAWDMASSGRALHFGQHQQFVMLRDGRHNRLVLPSGRSIWYRHARSHPSDRDPDRIDRRTFIGKSQGAGHRRIDTHGGKLTENVNQAIARDVLFDLIMRIEAEKNKPGRLVLHVHDEVVLEVPEKHADQRLADLIGMMAVPPTWAPGLVVKGEGGLMTRYRK